MRNLLPHCWLLGCVVLAGGVASAVETELPGPRTVQVGWSGLDMKTREVIVGNKGLLLSGAWFDENRRGLFGEQGLEASYRSSNGDNGRSDIVGAAYLERVPWQQQVYGGLGLGLWYSRVADREGGKVIAGFAPGAKAFVGYQFPKAVSGVRTALELAVLGTLPVHETGASGITAGLVVGF